MNEERVERLFLVSPELGTDPQIVEAWSAKEAVEKYIRHNGVPTYGDGKRFKSLIVRYVSDVVGTYTINIEETGLQPHPSYSEDAIS